MERFYVQTILDRFGDLNCFHVLKAEAQIFWFDFEAWLDIFEHKAKSTSYVFNKNKCLLNKNNDYINLQMKTGFFR